MVVIIVNRFVEFVKIVMFVKCVKCVKCVKRVKCVKCVMFCFDVVPSQCFPFWIASCICRTCTHTI